jgi:hypothetical protein
MRAIIFISFLLASGISTSVAQARAGNAKPCSVISEYRQFDFWKKK